MPTNANTFNSRVTSEALEAKFRQVFPAQNGAELPQDLFASGVIQPVIDFSSVAEGSVLGTNLQTAWDFSTSYYEEFATGTTAVVTNTGFWQIGFSGVSDGGATANTDAYLQINDGSTQKIIYAHQQSGGTVSADEPSSINYLVCFLRSGDSLELVVSRAGAFAVWSRQIADVYGNLVNPLGFTST